MTLLHQGRRPLTEISCILFDMDGTLLDSAPGVTASAAQALAAVGAPVPPMDDLRRFVGPPMLESFRTVSGLDEETAWKALQHYRKAYADHGADKSEPYDGIIDLLNTCSRQAFQWLWPLPRWKTKQPDSHKDSELKVTSSTCAERRTAKDERARQTSSRSCCSDSNPKA